MVTRVSSNFTGWFGDNGENFAQFSDMCTLPKVALAPEADFGWVNTVRRNEPDLTGKRPMPPA